MRRLSIVLSLLLVFALSASALGAFATTIKGYLETDIVYKQDDPNDDDSKFKLNARSRAETTLSISAGGTASGIKAVVNMRNAKNNTGWKEWTGGTGNNSSLPFDITSVRIESTGAYWKGGPELKTVAGTRSAKWNRYTGWKVAGKGGIEISGAEVGPVALRGIYGWKGANSTAFLLNASGNLDIIDFDAYLTNHGVQAGEADERHNDITIEASVNPLEGLALSGLVSLDGENKDTSMLAEAKLTSVPGFTFTGLVQMTGEDFDPMFSERKDGDVKPKDYLWEPDEKIYKVGAETNQAGVNLSGSFQLKNKYSEELYEEVKINGVAKTTIEGFNVGADVTLTREKDDNGAQQPDHTKTVLTASTKIANVNVSYKGTIETDKEMINELGANTTVDLFFADKVKLDGKVIFDENQSADRHHLRYGVDAKWTVPMGLDMTVGYANYNKSGKDWVNGEGDDGFYIRAYKKISF